MKTEMISHSTTETENIATEFAKSLKEGDFVALFGDLGVGKTAIVRGIAKEICPSASVKSPTYTIVNEYKKEGKALFHFDVYRITDDDDLYSMGFYDYLKRGTCVCEWSENIPWAIPKDAYRVTIERVEQSTEHRRIIIEKD
ncbi:MAG: tRNA (adenosine(37)-N6)-threonylcarbamoyltransferase complex ATPase subunit type 1 TsaE [Clostridia bacterium]|nr:tRNA (adenosine(37)-N6)-threonylcarbamoyltransferase complex ATPase subunit type 1 TsaE [Clostridia bacterium]